MAVDKVMQELKAGIDKLQRAYAKSAAARQQLVITAIVLRRRGYVLAAAPVADFDRARGAILRAAADLDTVLDAMRSEQPEAWGEITAAMNYQLQKIPSSKISSTSIVEMITVGLPEFPRALLTPRSSASADQAERIEVAEAGAYNMTPSSLGFISAIANAVGGGCVTATAALAPTGVGAVVVGVGCALLAATAVVGALYLTYKAVSQLPRLVQSFSPAAAASLAEADRLEAAAKYVKAANDAKVDPATLKEVVRQTSAQPQSDGIPWALIAVAAAAVLWFRKKQA